MRLRCVRAQSHHGAHGGALYLPRTTGGSKTRVVVGGWQRQGGTGAAKSRLLCHASPGSSRSDWQTFDEARALARSLGFESVKEWKKWSKSGERPPSDIPSNPDEVYKDEGWLSWGDFLGYNEGYVPGGWRDFEEARDFARSLGLESYEEWKEWSKSGEKPSDIPAGPDRFYKDEGWLSWGDFLGYDEGYVPGGWRDFEEARDFARSLGLESYEEWREWSQRGKKPSDIPSGPDHIYKGKGWLSWPDFLGFKEGYVAGEYLPFEEAREYVWRLGLKSQKEWREWIRSKEKPQDIPSHPELLYKDEGWLSWGDFLGYKKGHVAKARSTPKRRSFTDALGYARSLGLKSREDWLEFVKSGEKPSDIPARPDQFYKDKGWKSWGDFLGYKEGHVPGEYRPFEEARDYVWNLGLKSREDWLAFVKSGEKPSDIPARPDQFYKDKGWKSWGDFLGYKEGHVPGEYRPFEEARDYVWNLGLKSHEDWLEFVKSGKKPSDIPADPYKFYKDKGWLSWGDFLGYNKGHVARARSRRSFTEALGYARSLGLKSHEDWLEFVKSGKKPSEIPADPYKFYKDKGWLSWPDFLGYKEGHVPGEYRSFEEAREYARSLGLKNVKEWREWSKSGNKPSDIPSNPDQFYKGKGWKNWPDFLGY